MVEVARNVVLLDVGGVLRDARKHVWLAFQHAFEQKLKSKTPFSDRIMALKATPEYHEGGKFASAVYALWKSMIFEDEILNYSDPAPVIARAEEQHPLSPELVKEIVEAKNAFYYEEGESRLALVNPIEGAREALDELKAKGYRLGAFTNAVSSFNTPWLKHWKMWNYFEAVLAKDEVARAKPHSDGIHAVCSKMGVSPEQCYYVGDSAIDSVAAKQAGCSTVLVLTGYGNASVLGREKPDFVCESLLDFAKKLSRQSPAR